ncbi:MAG: hypothetical protein H6Q14_1966 [Bacteroidetes bacterium]|nr:hypothetical protein [Bacteroidota bacterium]
MKIAISTRTLLVALAILPISLFAQETVEYTFDLGGNGYYDGSTYTNLESYTASTGTFQLTNASTLGLTFGDSNATNVFRALTYGANVSSVDLTAIPTSTDQEATWTQYIKTSTSNSKSGIILRAQTTASTYSAQARQGYYFWAQNEGTEGKVRFRIRSLDATSGGTGIGDATVTISGYTTGPLYLKAVASGTSLSFYYSLDNSTWTTAISSFTNTAYSQGLVQWAWAVGSGSSVTDVYFDNITVTYTDATLSVSSTVSDDNSLTVTLDGRNVTINNVDSFSIYNISGAKVYETQSSGDGSTITLTPGVYIVKSGNTVKKFIIK